MNALDILLGYLDNDGCSIGEAREALDHLAQLLADDGPIFVTQTMLYRAWAMMEYRWPGEEFVSPTDRMLAALKSLGIHVEVIP